MMTKTERDAWISIPLEKFLEHYSFTYCCEDFHFLNDAGVSRYNANKQLRPVRGCAGKARRVCKWPTPWSILTLR